MSLRRQLGDAYRLMLGWRALQQRTARSAANPFACSSSSNVAAHTLRQHHHQQQLGSWGVLMQQQWQQQHLKQLASSSLRASSRNSFQQELRLCRGFAAQSAGAAGGGQAAAAGGGAAGGGKGTGKKSPISFNGMLWGVGAFLAIVAIAQNKAQQKVEGMMQRSQEVAGKAAVGGPFTLTDQDGKRFTNDNLLGKFSILYFGFTHCPDICPDEMEKLATALDLIEEQQGYQVCMPAHKRCVWAVVWCLLDCCATEGWVGWQVGGAAMVWLACMHACVVTAAACGCDVHPMQVDLVAVAEVC